MGEEVKVKERIRRSEKRVVAMRIKGVEILVVVLVVVGGGGRWLCIFCDFTDS